MRTIALYWCVIVPLNLRAFVNLLFPCMHHPLCVTPYLLAVGAYRRKHPCVAYFEHNINFVDAKLVLRRIFECREEGWKGRLVLRICAFLGKLADDFIQTIVSKMKSCWFRCEKGVVFFSCMSLLCELLY